MFATKKLAMSVCHRTVFVSFRSMSIISGPKEKHFASCVHYSQVRGKRKNSFNSLFESEPSKGIVGVTSSERKNTKKLTPRDITTILTDFIRKPEIRNLATEKGLNAQQLRTAFVRFRSFCLNGEELPVELEIVLNDILVGAGHPDDLFGQFMDFAMKMYPHLLCREELSRICDLRDPAAWYPQARSLGRKIIFHAGPTNSGKTYHALEKFMKAKSSVYCGPLKMLASEVFQKMRDKDIECDLATGDDRIYSNPSGERSSRLSCTVEMAPLQENFDVAVIDEIQLLQDNQRGWAWSRALLGIAAKEVHVCGEAAAIPLVKNLLATAGETVEVHEYKRLTGLKVEDSALISLQNVMPGDCLVCFSKRDLYTVTKNLENLGHRVAVIYGSLPPGAKLIQCQKFNDENDECNVMVATDAIGMGLNLNIRRIIFVSLKKVEINSDGKRSLEPLSVSQALQIAGRAGRYGTQYEEGNVTTLNARDLRTLKSMLSSLPQPAEKAGLYPTAEQIEMFSYHLPDSSLQSILEIFTDLCQMDDSLYFMCNIESFMYLAEKIDSIPLPLRARYVFCCSPVNIKDNIVVTILLRMARHFSKNKIMDANWLTKQMQWPPQVPNNIADMSQLESLHDVFDLYLWLSLRFTDQFQETDNVRQMKKLLDSVIVEGLAHLSRLMSNDGDNEESMVSKVPKVSKGSFADNLIQSGTISPEVLDRLKSEWKKEQTKSDKDTKIE
ncbi:ATP-dependent RNA helicase SUV3 homolog, mitochondrial [Frankliniella occidentalis]|uniref:ATP-dependent RNA helicase SUV3 homolog, mitochondrial n=1 Tax=Frankliniella occidentalis TaxID=133901 RepID=A0A6J1T5W3_FRAOC|nr:ATP-dependent RNA helicase SUV3 homolog, mitochondrial [Frankliniella occidentalis]